MKEEIFTNITNTLRKKPVEKEMVVYLMVEIRKFIERTEEESQRWHSLKYWCDWVVHTQLDKKFARETLNRMEKYIIENPDNKFHRSAFNIEFVSLENLRWELDEFLTSNELPNQIINVPPWDDFGKYLVEVLRDCPLIKTDGLVRGFQFIKKLHIPEAEKYSIDFEVIFDGSRPNLTGSVLSFEDKG